MSSMASKPHWSAKPVKCICTWKRCKEWQVVFLKNKHVRAGFITIKPGQKKTGPEFCTMLARHLSDRRGDVRHVTALAQQMRERKVIKIAYLHYTDEQVRLIAPRVKGGQNLNASTIIDHQLAQATCYDGNPDPYDRLQDGTHFISPNVPEEDVRLEVESLELYSAAGVLSSIDNATWDS
jgi:hypothetical protein